MAKEPSDTEAQDEAQDQAQDQAQGDEKWEPPAEPEYPEDGKGFDGTPVDEILEQRDERLDPDNRPENSEVSNAGREFDDVKGMFKDEEGYEEAEEKFDPEAT